MHPKYNSQASNSKELFMQWPQLLLTSKKKRKIINKKELDACTHS